MLTYRCSYRGIWRINFSGFLLPGFTLLSTSFFEQFVSEKTRLLIHQGEFKAHVDMFRINLRSHHHGAKSFMSHVTVAAIYLWLIRHPLLWKQPGACFISEIPWHAKRGRQPMKIPLLCPGSVADLAVAFSFVQMEFLESQTVKWGTLIRSSGWRGSTRGRIGASRSAWAPARTLVQWIAKATGRVANIVADAADLIARLPPGLGGV
jgi:hypothetical protein